jgi:hypothetical protein
VRISTKSSEEFPASSAKDGMMHMLSIIITAISKRKKDFNALCFFIISPLISSLHVDYRLILALKIVKVNTHAFFMFPKAPLFQQYFFTTRAECGRMYSTRFRSIL